MFGDPWTWFALLLVGVMLGSFLGLWAAVTWTSRTEMPPSKPGRIEGFRIRHRRRREWAARRAEYIRTGAVAPRRTNRVETW